jgi:hypothetical protein
MRKASVALVFLGLFLMTAAVLAPTYVYRQLAVIPGDADLTVTAVSAKGQPATYFDLSALKEVSAPLKSIAVVHGEPKAGADASDRLGRKVVVWDSYTCTGLATATCTTESLPLTGERLRLAFDAHTCDVLNWDGAYRETGGQREDRPRLTGYIYKLPFDVGKRTYAWWDPALGAAADLRYSGRTTVQGLDVYRFVQTIPPTRTGTIDLPGGLVGAAEPTVAGDQMVSSRLELTVEPESGVIVTRKLSIDNFVAVAGRRILTTTRGTFVLDERTVSDTVKTYGPIATTLYLSRRGVPVGAGILGALALVAGVVLAVRAHRRYQYSDCLDT